MKTQILLLLLCSAITGKAFSSVYYVSPTGDNTTGLSPTNAFQTIQQAADIAQAGDTVLVMNGTYTNTAFTSNVVTIGTKANAAHWLVFKNYPGDAPVIQMSGNWQGIALAGAAYVIVDGFTVIGNNDNITLAYAQAQQTNPENPLTAGNGISIQSQYSDNSNRSHHIIVRNCIVKKCGGGGIGSGSADYITIDSNTVSECGWYGPYDASGISLYQNWNSDSVITTKNFITNNTCFNNRNYIPALASGSITDGNGIIIDDSRNTQNNSTLGPYKSTTYIANNIVYGNGGRGIHVFSSDNVIAVNNTCYYNCQSPQVPSSELSAIYAGNVSFINNIAFPHDNLSPLSQYQSTGIIADHNLLAANAGIADPQGTNTKTGNPLFANASINYLVANFHLDSGSIAIHAGTKTDAPSNDHDGNTRTGTIDIGAYQYVAVAATPPPTPPATNPTPAPAPPATAPATEPVTPAVGLTAWAVNSMGTYNVLTWQYNSARSTDSIYIERGNNDTSITEVLGVKINAGSSSSNYRFTDSLPWNGLNYYRLRITSAESAPFYSPVISVSDQTILQANAYPNPVITQMVVTTGVNAAKTNLIQVFDENGRAIFSRSISNPSTTIDVSRWPIGWYVIVVSNPKERQLIPILKQ